MTVQLLGRLGWSAGRDDEGHRTYDLSLLHESDDVDDGPGVVGASPDIPLPGVVWWVGEERDMWAYCTPYMQIEQVQDTTPGLWTGLWITKQRFTTRPIGKDKSEQPQDPLYSPWKQRGSFTRSQREAKRDRNGTPLLTSSMEFIRGIQEDYGGATVSLTKIFSYLPLYDATSYRWHVNDGPMWGLPARCVKLVGFEWEDTYFGPNHYYTCTYTLEVNFDGWDTTAVDQGTQVLVEGGTPGNMADYRPTPDGRVVFLNGYGAMASNIGEVAALAAEISPQANLFALGLPTSF